MWQGYRIQKNPFLCPKILVPCKTELEKIANETQIRYR